MTGEHATPAVRPHYLRAYDDDLPGALALVVHDIVATQALSGTEARALVIYYTEMHEPPYGAHPHETALWVAEAVQEHFMDGDARQPPRINWPECPQHPEHPLWLANDTDDTDPAWTCPATEKPVAELGKL